MKTTLCLITVLLLAGFAAIAADESTPTEVAQNFYDAYMKVLRADGDTDKFVMNSGVFTASFKKAYAKMVKEGMDSDPIICGQDFPDEGYTASPAKFKDGKALVTMKSRSKSMPVSFKVTLRKIDGKWLISDTNSLKADAAD
jgi:ABC-type transporter MlaC component